MCVCVYIYIYVGFKTFFYVVRHLDSVASYLPTGLHLGFFHSWPSLYFPSSFSLVFLVLSFVLASYIQRYKNSETGRRGIVTKSKGMFIKCSKGTFLSDKVIQQKITRTGHTRERSVRKWGTISGKRAVKSACNVF